MKISDKLRAISALHSRAGAEMEALAVVNYDMSRLWTEIAAELENGKPEPPDSATFLFTRTPTAQAPRWVDTIDLGCTKATFTVTVTPSRAADSASGELVYVARVDPRDGKMVYRDTLLLLRYGRHGLRVVSGVGLVHVDKTRIDVTGRLAVGEANTIEVTVDLAARGVAVHWHDEEYLAKLPPECAAEVKAPLGVQVGGEGPWLGALTVVEVKLWPGANE